MALTEQFFGPLEFTGRLFSELARAKRFFLERWNSQKRFARLWDLLGFTKPSSLKL